MGDDRYRFRTLSPTTPLSYPPLDTPLPSQSDVIKRRDAHPPEPRDAKSQGEKAFKKISGVPAPRQPKDGKYAPQDGEMDSRF